MTVTIILIAIVATMMQSKRAKSHRDQGEPERARDTQREPERATDSTRKATCEQNTTNDSDNNNDANCKNHDANWSGKQSKE